LSSVNGTHEYQWVKMMKYDRPIPYDSIRMQVAKLSHVPQYRM